jgi:hypothetical protein
MRADRRRNVLAAARILGWTSRDGTTRPTRPRTAARMGVTERTVTRVWGELSRLGYLHCTEPGTTAAYRSGWHRHEGNLARTYTLVLPRTKENVAPPVRASCCKSSTPVTTHPQVKNITDEGYRRVTARFLRAGWLPRDIPAAVDAKPDGTRHAYDDPPRHPRAHMSWRLSWWLGPDGSPLPSPSQQRAARFVARMAGQDRRRAARKTGTAPPAVWHQARAELAERKRALR